MENYLLEAGVLFGNPQLWTDSARQIIIQGLGRENIFHVSQAERLYDLVPDALIRDIRKIGVIGFKWSLLDRQCMAKVLACNI